MDSLSLQRVEAGQNVNVESDIVSGFVDPEGRAEGGPGYSVVPRAPLAEGWYLLRADLSALLPLVPAQNAPLIFGPRRGNVLHARFYMGSRPMWHVVLASCGVFPLSTGRTCGFTFGLSESLPAATLSAATSAIVVRYDHLAVPCTPGGALADRDTYIGVRDCPEPAPQALVEVSMPTDLVPDVLGNPNTVVQFLYGEPPFTRTDLREGPRFDAEFTPHDDFGLPP
jgi:hypothetical protein